MTAVRVVTRIQDQDDFSGALTDGYFVQWVAADSRFELKPVSAGAVSGVSNSDGTLTVSPTTGAVVASINLAHANTWTGQQKLNAAAGTVKLLVQAGASESTDLVRYLASDGSTVLAAMERYGSLLTTNNGSTDMALASKAETNTGIRWFNGLLISHAGNQVIQITYPQSGNLVNCRTVQTGSNGHYAWCSGGLVTTIDLSICRQGAGILRITDGTATGIGDLLCRTPFIRRNAAPADAELSAGDVALWLDSTNGASKLMIKAKSANGTVVTGNVPLA